MTRLSRIIVTAVLLTLAPRMLCASSFVNEGYDYISLWDTGKALKAAEKAVRDAPMNAESYKLMGLSKFYNGDYAAAAESLEAALKIEPWNHNRENLLNFVSKTRDIIKAYKSYDSEHFTLRVHPRDRVLSYYILEVLEKAYSDIGTIFGYSTNGKIIVEIYSRRDDFNFASTLTKKQIEASGAIGICKFNRTMIVSPRCLAFGFRWMDSLVHEFMHYLLLHIATPDIPLWLNEGISKFYESRWRSSESLYMAPSYMNVLGEAVEKGEWIEFSKMRNGMPNLDDMKEVSLAFAQVSAGVDYIVSEYGEAKLVQLARAFKSNKDEKEVFKKVLGVSSRQYVKGLKEFIGNKNLQVRAGVVIDNYKIKDDEVDELVEFVGIEARGFVRLGDKFRKMKNYRVALIEYKKALELEPGNYLVLNKLGKTYFNLEEHEPAEEHLKKSLENNPNAANTYTNLGDLLFTLARHEEALEAYIQSNQLNPFNPAIHKSMGLIYYHLKKVNEALREFEVTGILAPYDTEIKSWLMHLKGGGQ